MFNFDQLWRDYAVYSPALQTYYTSFTRQTQAKPPLPSRLLPVDLDFLSPTTSLFKLGDALMSAGVVMDGNVHRLRNPLDDMVGHRDRKASYVTADSGGFQVLTKGLRIDNDLRLAQLRWSERYFDAALPVDVPSAALGKAGNPYFNNFALALRHTLESLDYWERHRDGNVPLVRMLVLQGHTPQQAMKWYEAVKGYHWEGIAWGGAMRFNFRHVLRLIRKMEDDGLLQNIRHIHFLGTSSIGFALFLTALRRSLIERLGRDMRVTFDTSTPFQYGHAECTVIQPGIDWSGSRPTLRTRAFEAAGKPRDVDICAPLLGSELGRRVPLLTMRDLRRKGVGYQGWDTPGRLLLSNHNVEMLCRAIIEANQQADLPDSIASPVQPAIIQAREAILDVFRKPENNIDYHAKQLNTFSAAGTPEGDLE